MRFAVLIFLLLSFRVQASIFPEGAKIYYPADKAAVSGLTEADLKSVFARVERIYGPEFRARGITVEYVSLWNESRVNAYAATFSRSRSTIGIYGGLVRHPYMTLDGLKLTICHEVGHLLGGAPLYTDGWHSSEGQADYFASAKCFRKLHTITEMQTWKQRTAVPASVINRCSTLNCQRSILAALALTKMLAIYPFPSLEKPDLSVVTMTLFDKYPSIQCRLDTYAAGSACAKSYLLPVSNIDPRVGTCNAPERGSRPRCWFRN